MLEIRPDQLQMFLDQAREGFTGRVVSYLKQHRPGHMPPDPAEFVKRQMAAAEGYNIRAESSVVKFCELAAVFGEDFHSSGKFPVAERILTQETDGAVKIEELCASAERGFES
jgi:hypothetical protein